MTGPSQGTALALDPDGILYGVSCDHQVRAFRSSDGNVIWRHAIGQLHYPSFANSSAVLGGAANALFVRPGSEATLVLDKRDGSELGHLIPDNGPDYVAGWTSNFALGFSGTIFEGLWFFDTCGHAVLQAGIPAQSTDSYFCGTLGFSDIYAVDLYGTDGRSTTIPNTNRLSLYDPQGKQVRGPTSGKGQPIAVGADGTLYTVSCYKTNPPENRLYAYDPDLNEVWHLDLGKYSYCPIGNGVLDTDGILYLAIPDEQGVGGDDIMAIQTKSPGLARSAWPMIRHDNRGTMWLTPLSANPLDGGVIDTSVDAIPSLPLDGGIDVPLQ
jgi:outer membrane protein assembly factor BamB